MVEYNPEATVRGAIAMPQDARGLATALHLDRRWLQWLPFVGVVLLSFGLNAWGASQSGYGNTYYAAAVRSMSMSWKNFFFGAFDPGGFITVDKPPAFLWVDALSVRIFGYSTLSLMLPSAVAGAASVALLWLIIRRYFGVTAATIAAAVLALTPISVAVNRLNLPEPFMILALLGAAGAVILSLDSRRWWIWVALAGTLVGFAFNVKMLAAWIPGPALALVLATRSISWTSARQLFLRLALLGVTTIAISASWMLIVDAWPASDRPYIGGSTDNTVFDLVLGYNGFSRVDGASQGGPPAGGSGIPRGPVPGGFPRPQIGGAGTQPPPPGQVLPQDGVPRIGGAGAPGGAGFNGAGGIVAGTPELLRLFDAANGGQIAWFLPFALGAGVIALWTWRRDPKRRAIAALFFGWVVLYGGVFSFAQGIFHSYYSAALAPGIAALVGIGAVAMTDAVKRDRRWLIVPIALISITVWTQLQVAGRTPDFYGWMRPAMIGVVLVGVVALIALAAFRRRAALAGTGIALAGLLLIPAAWSLSVSANASLNTTLPQAGEQQGASGMTFGSASFDNGTTQLAAWLQTNSDSNTKWQLVVASAQNASSLVAEYGISVMALGGFSGRDSAITVAEFADLVESGDVRYVLVSNGGPGGGAGAPPGSASRTGGANATNRTQSGGGMAGGPAVPPGGGFGGGASSSSAIISAARNVGTVVSDPSLPSQYHGQLYDVSGAADAIRALEP
jgi:4-amino-4-deoxy-L-arabinose transferase-like glycosyltransferase